MVQPGSILARSRGLRDLPGQPAQPAQPGLRGLAALREQLGQLAARGRPGQLGRKDKAITGEEHGSLQRPIIHTTLSPLAMDQATSLLLPQPGMILPLMAGLIGVY